MNIRFFASGNKIVTKNLVLCLTDFRQACASEGGLKIDNQSIKDTKN
jgi:hypothetical protein